MELKPINSPSLPGDLKYSNRIQIINAFLSNDICSASDIAAATGLSRQTVMKSIQFFVQSGLITSAGKGVSTTLGGKRPELFTLSQEKHFLCIALWPQELWLYLYTIGGRQIDSMRLTAALPADPKAAADNVGCLAQSLLLKNRMEPKNLCAVSVSTAGTVDYRTGCLKYSSQSPAWGADIPLKAYLQPYFGADTPVFIENAGKMTARPFLLEPELFGKRALVIFSCWGLSSCLIEKNHILSGKNSLIGEIGHMIIDPSDGEKCGCGGHGCLERLVSAERIEKLIAKRLPQYPDSLLSQQESAVIPALLEAAEKGDALAMELADYLAATFASALRNISLVFDPDLIVFQGDYACVGSYFDGQLRKHLQQFQYFPSEGPFAIQYDRRPLAEMNALGSYIALVNRYFNQPELYTGETDTESV
ncbi:MAG: ROK family transcriptional regulator [Oscillospiraceae bacterium]|nr:ROK family transcriptional regulator [Oscillospiraceae bacterium]